MSKHRSRKRRSSKYRSIFGRKDLRKEREENERLRRRESDRLGEENERLKRESEWLREENVRLKEENVRLREENVRFSSRNYHFGYRCERDGDVYKCNTT